MDQKRWPASLFIQTLQSSGHARIYAKEMNELLGGAKQTSGGSENSLQVYKLILTFSQFSAFLWLRSDQNSSSALLASLGFYHQNAGLAYGMGNVFCAD